LNKKEYLEFLYLFFLGALSSFSLPPYNFFIINFLTFSLFLIFLLKKKKFLINKKTSFFYGWLFGFGYFFTNLYWISISLTFDINFKFLIPITVILIPAFLAIFYGLVTFFFFILNFKKTLSLFFLFALLLGLVEFIRGIILTGFPWNLIAFSFFNHIEILQITSVIGTYAFNMFCISLFISPAIFILKKSSQEIIIFIFFLITPIILYLNGYFKVKNFQNIELTQNNYTIRAISSNIKLERFYGEAETIPVLDELIELSNPSLNDKILFLWPEGIIPNISQSELIEFKYLFNEKFNENHLLGLGINSQKTQNGKTKFFNSFSIYDNELNLIHSYEKVKLVPFGEFLPLEKILRIIGLKSLTNNYQSYSSGLKRDIIDINSNSFSFKILPLICYEIIYSGMIFKDNKFDYIVNISEDGWFGNSIGPYQHYAHSIFRAIESGKYVIRSSNNGITAIINPIGLAEQKIFLGKSGYIDFKEKRTVETTIFSKFGNKIFLLMILLYIFLIFSFNRNPK
tara:strand:- start:3196 stop:4737 length:1542 start_codon:yes stop_codon:yes gene_type:complete